MFNLLCCKNIYAIFVFSRHSTSTGIYQFVYPELFKCLRSSYKTNSSVRMMSQAGSTIFIGKTDHHKGVNINSVEEHCDAKHFAPKLQASLQHWQETKMRGVWFEVALEHSDWIPILVEQNGFRFHHARRDGASVTMSRWLPTDEPCYLPVYAHTMVGAGAIVVNEEGEMLAVRERYRNVPYWKLPGGYVEPGEDIGEAAQREVLEETNIRTEMIGLLALRHGHETLWGCSDMYFIVELRALSQQITPAQNEIEACEWMKIEDFKSHPQVHELNRRLICKYLENKDNGIAVYAETYNHPVTHALQTLYSAASRRL